MHSFIQGSAASLHCRQHTDRLRLALLVLHTAGKQVHRSCRNNILNEPSIWFSNREVRNRERTVGVESSFTSLNERLGTSKLEAYDKRHYPEVRFHWNIFVVTLSRSLWLKAPEGSFEISPNFQESATQTVWSKLNQSGFQTSSFSNLLFPSDPKIHFSTFFIRNKLCEWAVQLIN